jgi:hypothetical protein
MEMSGSPCPMGGAVGYTAKKACMKKILKSLENYMARITLFLLLLLLRNNAYAWYCNFQPDSKVTSFLDLCLAAVSQMMTLCRTIIAVGIDRMILIAQYIKSQYVALKLSIKPCLAQLTNQVLLIKVGLMNVLHSLGQGGQHLLTTVRQILQRVLNLLKRGN